MHGNVCTMYIGQMCDNNIIQMTMFTHIHCCALVKTTDDWRRLETILIDNMTIFLLQPMIIMILLYILSCGYLKPNINWIHWTLVNSMFLSLIRPFISNEIICIIRLKEILSFISSNYTLYWCGENTPNWTVSMIARQIYWNLKIFLLNGDTFKWISLSYSCSLWLKKNFEHVWHCSLWNTILSLKLKSSF